MTGEVIAIAITSAVAAFAGVVKAINGFNDKLQKRFYKLDSSHIDYVQTNNLTISKDDPHPNTKGHEQWATLLKEYIDANNLRTF